MSTQVPSPATVLARSYNKPYALLTAVDPGTSQGSPLDATAQRPDPEGATTSVLKEKRLFFAAKRDQGQSFLEFSAGKECANAHARTAITWVQAGHFLQRRSLSSQRYGDVQARQGYNG